MKKKEEKLNMSNLLTQSTRQTRKQVNGLSNV
jgi:hypothetical protein